MENMYMFENKKSRKEKFLQGVLVAAAVASFVVGGLLSKYLPVSEWIGDLIFTAGLVLGMGLFCCAAKMEVNTDRYCCCNCQTIYVPEGRLSLSTRKQMNCPRCNKSTTHVFIPKESL